MAESQITSRFGANVRGFRHRLGISQETLAERADLHRTYISEIENGQRNVTLKSVEKLAHALQVSVVSLFLPDNGQAGLAKPSAEESFISRLAMAHPAGETLT